MEFPFGRQTSRDSLRSKTEEAGRSLRSSITSGSSRLFDSVMSKKNGIFDGISSGITSTIDQVKTIGGAGTDDDEEAVPDRRRTSEDASSERTPSESGSTHTPTRQPHPKATPPGGQPQIPQPAPRRSRSPVQEPGGRPAPPQPAQRKQPQQPPHKPTRPSTTKPPPARPARPPAPSRGKVNGSIRGQPGPGRFSRQQTAPADFDPSGTSTDAFDSPQSPNRRQYSLRSGSVDMDRDAETRFFDGEAAAAAPTNPDVPGPDITSTRISRNPFLDNPDHECTQVLTEAEVYPASRGSRPEANSTLSDLDPIGTSAKQASGSLLGTDLLPGIPRVPSNNMALLAPSQQHESRDLLAITPTSGEALPMPSIEPTTHRRTSDTEIYDDSDGDSVATEGCDEAPDPEDYGGADYDYGSGDPSLLRSGSFGSDIGSWHSNLSADRRRETGWFRCLTTGGCPLMSTICSAELDGTERRFAADLAEQRPD
ncbi:hypothetical protein LSH36_224g07014 [Paralvinella palmiformis]|uniref:Uncharacterized protein n=1 Tax=Paralvinella palmiformis TaxID=53620 RepID=A0AAD9N443_9ANNE|nr:hypothetical protein LSH36_224g07014 [Paralvinella palmiformis]